VIFVNIFFRKYWSDLEIKFVEEGFEVSEKIGQLKFIVGYSFAEG